MSTWELSEFILSFKKKSTNDEYARVLSDPSSQVLTAIWRAKDYGYSIVKDAVFERTRKTLQAKQRDLKKKGIEREKSLDLINLCIFSGLPLS